MAEKFARKRMAQICKDDANYKPSTVVHIKTFVFWFALYYEEGFGTVANWTLGLSYQTSDSALSKLSFHRMF